VQWQIDRTWLKQSPPMIAKTRRFMVRLLTGGLLLWLVLMTAMLCNASRADLSKTLPLHTVKLLHG
jgi:hypothetical protein